MAEKRKFRQRHVAYILNFTSSRLGVLRRAKQLSEAGKDKHGYYWTPNELMAFASLAGDTNSEYIESVRARMREMLQSTSQVDLHRKRGRPKKKKE